MFIKKLIEELHKEIETGKEEIFVVRGGFSYDFDLGIDDKGNPVISLLKHPAPVEQTST